MKPILILLFLLTFCIGIYANTVEQYVKTKNGITLYAIVSAGSTEERKIQDAFLDRLVQKLKRPNKSIPIHLWADQFHMFFGRQEWFAAIAYDTLRSPDPSFIENYLYYRMGPAYREQITRYSKPPSNKHQVDLPEPIDLGSSYDTGNAPVGLRIYYDYGSKDSATGWDRLFTLVQYAIDHAEEIKEKQKRIVLPYPVSYLDTNYRKTEISLLTIDTNKIQNIPLLSFGFDHTKLDSDGYRIYIWVGAVALVLLLLVASRKKRKLLT